MRHPLVYRILCGMIGWGTVGIIYQFTGQFSEHATKLMPSWLDKNIAYSVQGIWLYLSFFLFIPCGYLLAERNKIVPLMLSMQLCALLSGIIYLLFPTTMDYPNTLEHGLAQQLVLQLVAIDTQQNLLPSLHVSLTLLVLYALWSKTHKIRTAGYFVWALLICFSVIQLRRHLVIDVISGIITATMAWYVVDNIQLRRQENYHE
ncbi:phosphatase PAP2 family protein [Moellerella wisconsensis]|uniref:phosphatase PAP2 family protein n=1 Tax=Moellerella wisconsensis TaxID=158849 RepID=UPI001F4E86EC|nr:phosphatase PAP2 family protein [Moellerella wisconsensis]UNH26306.1 phosphatase PAP2 family protein [Moellerella wisconsensis]